MCCATAPTPLPTPRRFRSGRPSGRCRRAAPSGPPASAPRPPRSRSSISCCNATLAVGPRPQHCAKAWRCCSNPDPNPNPYPNPGSNPEPDPTPTPTPHPTPNPRRGAAARGARGRGGGGGSAAAAEGAHTRLRASTYRLRPLTIPYHPLTIPHHPLQSRTIPYDALSPLTTP